MSMLFECACGKRARLANGALGTDITCKSCGQTTVCSTQNTDQEMSTPVVYVLCGGLLFVMAFGQAILADLYPYSFLGGMGGLLKGCFIILPPWLLLRELRPKVR